MKKYVIDGDATDIERLIDQKIHSARKRRIMKLWFLDGLTYEEIARDEQVDRTPRQIGNIIRECAPKLL